MRRFVHRWSILAPMAGLCLLGFGTSQAFADKPIFIETFDIAPVPCDGLELAGVTYSFTVAGAPSLDCRAGTRVGPGVTNNIRAPNIEGTAAGILHLTFNVPTTHFDFGVAQSTFSSPQSVVINLNAPGHGVLREEAILSETNDPGFVGGRFTYDGPAVKTATISFSTAPFTRFALDNVSYFAPPGQAKKFAQD
jgi:hypothetical protein